MIVRVTILVFMLLSNNVIGQNKFGISISEGYFRYNTPKEIPNFEGVYIAKTLQTEIEANYKFYENKRFDLRIGLGIAQSDYLFDTGFLFPIQDKSNSVFTRLNTKVKLGESSLYLNGNYSLYYVPPLFRKYYSQKNFFNIVDIGIGYKLKKDWFIDVGILTSISSPFYTDRLGVPFSINGRGEIRRLEKDIAIRGLVVRLSKSIF